MPSRGRPPHQNLSVATVVNAGSIGASDGYGVFLERGGSVTNHSGGTISGGADAVRLAAGLTNLVVIDPGAVFAPLIAPVRWSTSCSAAKMVTGVTPDRVTTDEHDSYPRAIRTPLGSGVWHRDSRYLNNRLEQDHRGIKGRYGPMRGFKCPQSAGRFCQAYDELRNFLHSRSRTNQTVSADYRKFHFLRRAAAFLRVLQAA
jgi:DDE domain